MSGKVENLMDESIIQDVTQRFEGLSAAGTARTELLLKGILIELRIANGRTPETKNSKKIQAGAKAALESITNFRA